MNAATQATMKDLARADGDLETRLFLNASYVSSLAQMALFAAATAFFIGWWALAWFTAMTAMFVFTSKPGGESQIPEGLKGAVTISAGGVLFVSPAAAAYLIGGAEASFIVGIMLGTQALMGVTLFASSTPNFWANLLPSLAVTVIVPFFALDSMTALAVTLLCVAQIVLATMSARANRNDMLEEVLRIQGEMEAARKESLAKSQFLATMSHELRTPLNAVIGYAEILEEELKDDGRAGNAADAARISRSARSLLTLINEILDFSKIEAGRMEVDIAQVDIEAVVADVTQTIAHITSAHRTTIHVEITPEARAVCTDGQRLRQCLLNLASNAAKFTEGGSISIRADMEHDCGDAFLRIAVADTGCGISEQDAARLFQPFTQIDGSLTRRKDGTGLGLVITKRLAELMGGDIRFVSAQGKGSTFTLRVRDHASEKAAPIGEGPLVLVIEDEPAARDLSRRMLAHLPLAVAEARTGAEGMSAIRARRPSLVILDIHLPDCKGWQVLEDLKADEALCNTPVLVVSADDDRGRAIRLGACEHMLKPVEKDQLAAAVLRYALTGARVVSSDTAAARTTAAA